MMVVRTLDWLRAQLGTSAWLALRRSAPKENTQRQDMRRVRSASLAVSVRAPAQGRVMSAVREVFAKKASPLKRRVSQCVNPSLPAVRLPVGDVKAATTLIIPASALLWSTQ